MRFVPLASNEVAFFAFAHQQDFNRARWMAKPID
jgi:hypothetical protein